MKNKLMVGIVILLVVILGAVYFYQKSAQKNISEDKFSGVLNSADNTAPAQIANPASVNCEKVGGRLTIEKRGDGGEYGLCYFEDNRACEEWALFREECPVGGVKTTGYDTIDQKYCAWSGGQTSAVPNSVCIFKDGLKCTTKAFYDGECPASK